jgi:hypothetical protein
MASSQVTSDHEEIRRWAEERGAKPACVRGTGSGEDTGVLRLDFPGYSGGDSLEHISWDEWFRKFDESGLALLLQDKTAGGQKSNFNKLISRETAESSRSGGRSSRNPSRRARASSKGGRKTTAAGGRKKQTATASRRRSGASAASKTRARKSNQGAAKSTRGSTRAKRTQSVRGRAGSRRRAA